MKLVWKVLCCGICVSGLFSIPGMALAAGDGMLKLGDNGNDVIYLQKALYKQGFYKSGEITGYFGNMTQKAVIAFQNKHKLWPDGVAGTGTRKILLGSTYKGIASRSNSGSEKTYAPGSFRAGSEGSEVKKLQLRLKSLGYYAQKDCTGFYGPITSAAIKKFQAANGLKVDSIAGKYTIASIYSKNAKKPSTSKASASKASASKVSTKSTGQVASRSAAGNHTAAGVIAFANRFLGRPYVYGANGPSAFDCTGFTSYVFRSVGISLPRTAKDQGYSDYGIKVSKGQLEPGDLVYFNTNPRDGDLSDHAGIYIGNGSFIHASSSTTNGKKVSISNLNQGFYSKAFIWGRRVLR